jgi:hypothetical protein
MKAELVLLQLGKPDQTARRRYWLRGNAVTVPGMGFGVALTAVPWTAIGPAYCLYPPLKLLQNIPAPELPMITV